MKYRLLPLVLINAAFVAWLLWPKDDSFRSYLGLPIGAGEFDRYVEAQMAEKGVPGVSVAVVNHGELVHHATFGYANVEDEVPVRSDTIFEAASISKPMFGFFVMRFVDEGKIDLDRPLYQYYPHPDLASDPRHEAITARMVLSHQSGLPNWRENELGQTLKIHFDPGTDYLYSGEGYQYLAAVLREIENTDWAGLEAAFQRMVAEPLGLAHTVYVQTPFTRAHKAEPYDSKGEWIDWPESEWFLKEDGNFFAPSSMHTESLDFSRWLKALMNRELLSAESYRELFKPHSSATVGELQLSYTLGFFELGAPFTDLYFHTGNNVGFESWFAVDLEDNWGFAMFANSDQGEGLGESLFFYLLTGPDPELVLAVAVLSLMLLLLLLARGFKWMLAARRARAT
ncbi:MAG: serine hydrolase domain-containing protein [Myxococcota bacterium]